MRRTSLLSTIGPLAVGVLLAFGWNMVTSQPHDAAGAQPGITQPGITQQVGQTVEEVATRAWANTSPRGEAGAGGHAPASFGR